MNLNTQIDKFLTLGGWQNAQRTAITPDWSPRQFWRLKKIDGRTAVLIHAPDDIPGHGLDDFLRLSETLLAANLSAPKIYIAAPSFLLVEDFGNTPIDTPSIEKEAYEAAVDALAILRKGQGDLVSYKDGYIYKKLALYSDDPAWMAAWDKAEAALPPAPLVFSHMDYKAGNLHWLPEREGVKRIGLLDFQAAQYAPFTYDIVNLLEDARRDVPDKDALKKRFKDALPDEWKPLFDDWYVFIAAQFHARVLGQIRNNPRVTPDVAPRLKGYLRAELQAPTLGPVRDWGQKTGLLI